MMPPPLERVTYIFSSSPPPCIASAPVLILCQSYSLLPGALRIVCPLSLLTPLESKTKA
jgi:hypothetical protein